MSRPTWSTIGSESPVFAAMDALVSGSSVVFTSHEVADRVVQGLLDIDGAGHVGRFMELCLLFPNPWVAVGTPPENRQWPGGYRDKLLEIFTTKRVRSNQARMALLCAVDFTMGDNAPSPHQHPLWHPKLNVRPIPDHINIVT